MSDLEEFYDQHVEKVYKFFYIQCLDVPLAEDLTSQTFVSFIQRSSDITTDDKKYLYGIMRNVWADYLRLKYKERIESIEKIEDFAQFADTTVDEYESQPAYERAVRYIEKLPEAQRVIATMRFIEEKSVKEVAELIGKNRFYVKTTQYRALKNLRKMFNEPDLGRV